MLPIEWKTSCELVDYEEAVQAMEARVAAIHAGEAKELVWFVEHPPLYTAGTSAKEKDLLDAHRFPVYHAGRGGEYTYHGPGQRVVYVLLNLKERKQQDIRCFVHKLEQWVINTLAEFGVKGERREKRVGIWVDEGYGRESKICALGIRVRKWITFHGIALNVNPDLEHFSGIVPCGIQQYGVTSLHALGKDVTMAEIDVVLKEQFEKIFSV